MSIKNKQESSQVELLKKLTHAFGDKNFQVLGMDDFTIKRDASVPAKGDSTGAGIDTELEDLIHFIFGGCGEETCGDCVKNNDTLQRTLNPEYAPNKATHEMSQDKVRDKASGKDKVKEPVKSTFAAYSYDKSTPVPLPPFINTEEKAVKHMTANGYQHFEVYRKLGTYKMETKTEMVKQ